MRKTEVCINVRSTSASLPFKGQVTEQTTVKWPILKFVLTDKSRTEIINKEMTTRKFIQKISVRPFAAYFISLHSFAVNKLIALQNSSKGHQ